MKAKQFLQLLLKERNYREPKHRSTTPPQGKKLMLNLDDINMYLKFIDGGSFDRTDTKQILVVHAYSFVTLSTP